MDEHIGHEYALREMENALNEFKRQIEAICNEMETNASTCQSILKDEKSQDACKKIRIAASNIRDVLSDVQNANERINNMLDDIHISENHQM